MSLWYGSDKRGSEQAPNLLCDAITKQRIIDSIEPIMPLTTTDKYAIHSTAKYLREIIDVNKRLAEAVNSKLQLGNRVLTIGGDHSLGLGSVAGSLQFDENVALIWFDAHGDMNTEQTSPTGNVHGMPVAALMGLCDSALNDVAKVNIKPQNIFWIGARDLDEGERQLVSQFNLNVYSTEYIHVHGMQRVMNEVVQKMQKQGVEHVHLSFDIDAMDPTIVAATGCLVPNGLNNTDFDIFVQSIASLQQHIIALDFVEYNPLLDDSQQTSLGWCCHALKQLCNAIVRNNG